MTRLHRLVTQLRRRAGAENGAVLVIVAGLMTVLMASGAVAIDLSSGRATETRAQTAADAAALAGADTLSAGGSSSSITQTSEQIASDNLPGSVASVSQPTGGEVKVSVSDSSAGTFGEHFGMPRLAVSATATASVTGTESQTSTRCTDLADASCLAVFAAATGGESCSQDSYNGGSNPNHIAGETISDGSIDLGSGSAYDGPVYYSNASGCTATGSGATAAAQAPITSWPINYAEDFPSCSGLACTGPDDTPSFCTDASTQSNWELTPGSDEIYCAIGTGTSTEPSTWNGAITLEGGAYYSSYVGGSVTTLGDVQYVMSPCGGELNDPYEASWCSSGVPTPITGYYPLFYMTGSGNAITMDGSGSEFEGDSFAPNGTIQITSASNVAYFLEAQDIDITAASNMIDGTGPVITGSGSETYTGGSVSLSG